jgi:spore germination protein YaaH
MKKYLFIFIPIFLSGCITGVSLHHPVSKYVPQVSVWLPFWDWERTVGSFRKNKDLINEVIPFWYDVTSTGTLVPAQGISEMIAAGKLNLDYAQFVTDAHRMGAKVLPLVSNEFNGNLIHQILSNAPLRNQHIQNIVQLVFENHYDGIDIDYEGMLGADRALYPEFLQELATQLHRKNKKLSVCVHAKTSEPGGWDAVIAQDYQAIGRYADTVRIMGYDFHYAGGDPGAIAPLDWVEKVLKFAVTKIPAEKISLGIPIYGINWYDRDTSGRVESLTRPNVGLKDEEAMYLDAVVLAKQYHARIHFDEPGQSHWFTYTDASTGIKRTVWFESHFGFKSRWELAKQYKVAGISLWRIGGEDPKLWQYLRSDKFIGFNDTDFWLFEMDKPPHTHFGLDLILSH